MLQFKKISDKFRDEAEYLAEDRASSKTFRYKESIGALLDQA